MNAYIKQPESKATIRFQDCDPMGHLHNSRYIDYFINAREDHLLSHYNIDFFKNEKDTNNNWYVSESQVSYLYPAFLKEEVTMCSRLIKISSKSVQVDIMMLDSTGYQLKAFSSFQFTYVQVKTGRPVSHPEYYLSVYNKILYKTEEEMPHYYDRLKSLKIELKKEKRENANR